MIAPILFVACFMFLAVLLLLGVIYSRIHWVPKAILVAVSLLFGGIFYHAYMGSLGYPAQVAPPRLFRFVYGMVREPYLLKDDPGAIYVWMLTPGGEVPRVVTLPYSAATRKIIGDAKKKVQDGEVVYMGLTGEGQNQSDSGGKASSSAGGDSAHKLTTGPNNTLPYDVRGDKTLEFEAPPDTVPKKDKS